MIVDVDNSIGLQVVMVSTTAGSTIIIPRTAQCFRSGVLTLAFGESSAKTEIRSLLTIYTQTGRDDQPGRSSDVYL